jgi:hypothetical protein
MSTFVRFSAPTLLLLLAWIGVVAMQSGKTPPDRSALLSAKGEVVLDTNGRRYIYPEQGQMARQDLEASATPPPDPWTGTQSTWNYSEFGSAIGMAGMIVAPGSPYPEIFVASSTATFGSNDYWYVLQYNPVTRQYDQTFASSQLLPGFRRMVLANVAGDSTPELVVALANGKLVVYNSKTKKYIKTLNTAAGNPYNFSGPDMAIADIDGDGVNEIVLSQSDSFSSPHLYVYSVDGNLKWDIAGIGGTLAVGQMDSDAAQEIALSDGHVIDGATHAAQWFQPSRFDNIMIASDTDGDGIKELVTGGWNGVIAYDVAHQTPKWSFPIYYNASGVVRVADLDGDQVPELILGTNQWGGVYAYDIRTLALKWHVDTPNDGITNITIADVDNDGTLEVLWTAGYYDTGSDHLFVTDPRTQALKWQSFHLDGPFLGPFIGDLDGDGRKELVTASFKSESGYDSARILVFDATSHRLRAVSSPIVGPSPFVGSVDLKLQDVDRDGRMEILICAGFLEVYKFAADNTFQLSRFIFSTGPYSSAITAIDAADLDNDGQTEIIGSNAQSLVQVFSYNTGLAIWSTSVSPAPSFSRMAITDLEGDGIKDIVGITQNGIYAVDSALRGLKGQVTGQFTDFAVQNASGSTFVWVSTPLGYLIKYRFTAGAFNEISRIKLADEIDAFTLDGVDRVWISSNGTLKHMTLSGALLKTFSGFGWQFGVHVELANPSGFYTTGTFSVMGFGIASEFDICIQDDSRGDTLQFSSITGAYQFTQCGSAFSLNGTGTVSKRGSTVTLQDYSSGRRVVASVDATVNRGNATIQISPLGTVILIDRIIANNTCSCA